MTIDDRKSSKVSPIYNDLSRLCPALFMVGTEDPLIDDCVLMHFRWLRAGNQATLRFIPGGAHGFTLLDASTTEVAAMGMSCIKDFIQVVR
jgi:acetyl esterase/lipase